MSCHWEESDMAIQEMWSNVSCYYPPRLDAGIKRIEEWIGRSASAIF